MVREPCLQGLRVLVAHESAAQRAFLGEAVRSAGAILVGTITSLQGASALLAGGERVHAMVLSPALPGRDALRLAAAAVDAGVRTLIVHRASQPPAPPLSDHRCPTMPYTGHQVAAALAQMLATTRGGIHWSSRGW